MLINTSGSFTSSSREYSADFFILFKLTRNRFGPHKIAKILHQAFCMTSNGQPLQTSIISPPQSEPATPLLASPSENLASPPIITAQDYMPPRIALQAVQNTEPRNDDEDNLLTMKSLKSNAAVTISEQTTPTNGTAPDKKEVAGMRVLLVEDNEINLKLLIATMRKLKLEHATAVNGLEAYNCYKDCEGRFDVIFMGLFAFPSTSSLSHLLY